MHPIPPRPRRRHHIADDPRTDHRDQHDKPHRVSDDALWEEVLRSTGDEEEEEPFYPQFTVVDDRQFESLTIGELLDIVGPDRTYIFLADQQTMTDPEHPLLVVDTGSAEYELHTPGQSLRVTQPGIESIESNLSIANMDFVSFVDSADSDGVFRGFEQPANPPQYQELPVATLRAGVMLQLDLPLFAELLHDLNTDDHGDMILVDSPVDMRGTGRTYANSPYVRDGDSREKKNSSE